MAATLSPLYSPKTLEKPSFHLRFTWTGWPTAGEEFPPQPSEEFFNELNKVWRSDGIRFLEPAWASHQIQLTCSVLPTVSPIFFTSRVKGRLQHALRTANRPVQFSRKVGFRAIGDNSREEVEAYIAKQVTKERFVDPRFVELLDQFTVQYPNVHLQEPVATASGRYWYNVHVVLVTESRMRFTDEASLAQLSALCDAIAAKKGYRVSARSVMPDHIHIALGGDIEQSPQEIALAFMNNTAYGFGQKNIWRPSYYVGSFSEYDMGAVRGR